MKIKYADELPEIVIRYLNYKSAIKNESANTINGYALDLKLFIKYLYKEYKPGCADLADEEINITDCKIDFLEKVTLNDAYAFLVFCKDERGNKSKARARKVSAIRGLYKYLYNNQHLISQNPMENLDIPKIEKKLPKYLTLEQSLELLQCIDGPYKQRDYCIITLFLNCGMRLSELCSLNIQDIRSDNTMRVTGKGSKQRTIYLNDACVAAINNYLKYRPVEGIRDKNALFISRNKNRISPKTVQYIVNKFLDKAGLSGQGFSVHKLRHTAATLMYQYGDVDVLLLKEILGHESTSTTEIYTHVVNEQLQKAANANPLAGVVSSDRGGED